MNNLTKISSQSSLSQTLNQKFNNIKDKELKPNFLNLDSIGQFADDKLQNIDLSTNFYSTTTNLKKEYYDKYQSTVLREKKSPDSFLTKKEKLSIVSKKNTPANQIITRNEFVPNQIKYSNSSVKFSNIKKSDSYLNAPNYYTSSKQNKEDNSKIYHNSRAKSNNSQSIHKILPKSGNIKNYRLKLNKIQSVGMFNTFKASPPSYHNYVSSTNYFDKNNNLKNYQTKYLFQNKNFNHVPNNIVTKKSDYNSYLNRYNNKNQVLIKNNIVYR